MSTPASAPDTIVFIHGLWMTPKSWEGWQAFFQARGYRTIAPGWPGVGDQDPAALRADGSSLAGTDARAVLEHYAGVIEALDAKPVIIGHSFGGAFTQVLIDRGMGAAGVPIDSAPVAGIRDLPVSTLRSSFGVLGNPLNFGKAVPFTPEQFRYAFGNTLSEDASQAAWEAFAIPAASKVLFQGAAANLPYPPTPFKVRWKRAEGAAPLLFLGGGKDHVVPAKVSKKNAARYAPAADYVEFADRSHFIAGEPGWEEVAERVATWIAEQVGAPAGAASSA